MCKGVKYKYGINLSRHYDMNFNIEDMKFEYEIQERIINEYNKMNKQKEYINSILNSICTQLNIFTKIKFLCNKHFILG